MIVVHLVIAGLLVYFGGRSTASLAFGGAVVFPAMYLYAMHRLIAEIDRLRRGPSV